MAYYKVSEGFCSHASCRAMKKMCKTYMSPDDDVCMRHTIGCIVQAVWSRQLEAAKLYANTTVSGTHDMVAAKALHKTNRLMQTVLTGC